jgi:hypothetical protein
MFSARPGFCEIKHSGLNRVEHRVSDESARAQDFNADQLAFGIEFRRDIRADLDAARLRLIGYGKMQNVVLLKVCHACFIHSRRYLCVWCHGAPTLVSLGDWHG